MLSSKSKLALKKIVPKFFRKLLMQVRSNQQSKIFENLSTEQTFTKIYAQEIWGPGDYNSGTGSHTDRVVNEYILAVSEFLTSFDNKLDVVDLGCGDFAVGSILREHCNNYIACDVVDSLITTNTQKFAHLDVDFKTLDIAENSLPEGDVVFVRQVLQHLRNEQIHKFLAKLQGKFQYLILTEHLPESENFVPNIDKRTGPDIRVFFNSGVVLTEEPFCLKYKSVTTLCDVHVTAGVGGRIQTNLYTLQI